MLLNRRKVLALKHLRPLLNECLIYVVNFIKSHPLKSRIKKKLCKYTAAQLCYTTAKYNGKFLLKAFEPRQENLLLFF